MNQLNFYLKNREHKIPFIRESKKGGIELDEMGKVILGAILLVVLIGIIIYIKGGFDEQGDKTIEVTNIFK